MVWYIMDILAQTKAFRDSSKIFKNAKYLKSKNYEFGNSQGFKV